MSTTGLLHYAMPHPGVAGWYFAACGLPYTLTQQRRAVSSDVARNPAKYFRCSTINNNDQSQPFSLR